MRFCKKVGHGHFRGIKCPKCTAIPEPPSKNESPELDKTLENLEKKIVSPSTTHSGDNKVEGENV